MCASLPNMEDPLEDPIDEWPPRTPASATKVTRRSLVLATMVCRGHIESGVGDSEAEALHPRLLEWLTRLDLWDEVEPNEEKILRVPLGTLAQKDMIQAT